MDLVKLYIVQCISVTANNLRLSSQKIEIVGLLKDAISHSTDLRQTITDMKKVTVLSKLAIRIGDIYSYLISDKLEFMRISDKFREHCQLILRDMNFLLDSTSVQEFKETVNLLLNKKPEQVTEENLSPIEVNLISQPQNAHLLSVADPAAENGMRQKETFILEDDPPKPTHDFFQNFEENILKPVKELDTFLGRLAEGNVDEGEVVYYSEIMKNNRELARKFGATLVADMHGIFRKGLDLIHLRKLETNKDTAENLRSCLIVIVALIKNKEVDIKPFLNRAEAFADRLEIMDNY
ncbi:MAG: hypothetical protein AB9882_05760 [Ignavibacteriaceae bacterium]